MSTRWTKRLILITVCGSFFGCSSAPKDHGAAGRDPASVGDANMQAEPVKIDESSGYVVDAGSFTEGVTQTEVIARGGKNGRFIQPEKYISLDRQKNAPLGKNFYVLVNGTQSHCIRSKFVEINGKKVLLTYPKSSVPVNYCVYQKSFEENGQGFSLVLDNGPVCRPSYSAVKSDNEHRKIASVEEVSNNVPISYCVDETISYGEQQHQVKHAE